MNTDTIWTLALMALLLVIFFGARPLQEWQWRRKGIPLQTWSPGEARKWFEENPGKPIPEGVRIDFRKVRK